MLVSGPARKAGFTLLELAVVIAIAAVLLGLLLASIQRVRNTANQTTCANNLRQIGLAFHEYHGVHLVLPSHGGGVSVPVRACDGSYFTPTTTFLVPPNSTYYFAIGSPLQGPKDQMGSWLYSLLPFVEHETAFRTVAWDKALTVLTCPIRRSPVAVEADSDQYGEYSGGGWRWAKTDYACNGMFIRGRPFCLPLSFATDGASLTILAGEKALNPKMYDAGGWFYDEPFFLGGAPGNRRTGFNLLKDGPDFTYVGNWGSAHIDSAMFLFADGSVKSLKFGTPTDILRALLTPTGGEPIVTPD